VPVDSQLLRRCDESGDFGPLSGWYGDDSLLDALVLGRRTRVTGRDAIVAVGPFVGPPTLDRARRSRIVMPRFRTNCRQFAVCTASAWSLHTREAAGSKPAAPIVRKASLLAPSSAPALVDRAPGRSLVRVRLAPSSFRPRCSSFRRVRRTTHCANRSSVVIAAKVRVRSRVELPSRRDQRSERGPSGSVSAAGHGGRLRSRRSPDRARASVVSPHDRRQLRRADPIRERRPHRPGGDRRWPR
jgi:hypothetical protein